jgi:GT2 family glycosyltransferase
MTRIAIVILNWNGSHHLKRFLPSVCRYSLSTDNKVYLVDNGSTDDSLSMVRSAFPAIEVIEFPLNFGFAQGYYHALKQIEATYYVLLNSDVEVSQGWLEPLYACMEEDHSVGACMPRMRDFNQPDHFEYAGAAGGFIDYLGYPFCRGRLLSSVEIDTGQYDLGKNIFWASGACMFVRSSAYFRVGGLDGDFFAHMEEIDLCWRMRRIGYIIKAVPDSIVYHIGGGTLPNNNPHKLYLNYRNNLFLLFKNLTIKQLIPILVSRMILDGMSAAVYLFSGSGSFCYAVFRAHLAFYRSIPRLIRKRIELKSTIGRVHIQEIYRGSILFDFFIRKRRYFNQLEW